MEPFMLSGGKKQGLLDSGNSPSTLNVCVVAIAMHHTTGRVFHFCPLRVQTCPFGAPLMNSWKKQKWETLKTAFFASIHFMPWQ